jgi:anti-anti-sigma factor
MLTIDRLESGAVTVLRIEGDIDEEGVDTLRLSLNTCMQDQRRNVVANMTAVKFVSYMGVGVLVERLRHLRACHGDLKLTGVNIATDRLLRMAGVKHLFDTHETEPKAIQAFREAA